MKKTKLFIIDYNQKFIEDFKEEIEKEGELEVVGSCNDGNKAIEILDTVEDIDILIVNLVLPNLDGLAILKHLSQETKQKFKKIIATSIFATADIMNVLRELNVVYFMMYPYSAKNILEVLNNYNPLN